jgi:hypothetical protein
VTEDTDHISLALESRTLARLRAILMGTLVLGIVGTGVELWLLDHTEGWQQLIPLVLLGAGLFVCASQVVRPTLGTVRLLQAVMLLFVISGAVGVLLHYQGNVEFELEMYPDMAGMELFKNTVTGATPVLAPGTMLLLGLVGLAYTYHHPRVRRQDLGWMEE